MKSIIKNTLLIVIILFFLLFSVSLNPTENEEIENQTGAHTEYIPISIPETHLPDSLETYEYLTDENTLAVKYSKHGSLFFIEYYKECLVLNSVLYFNQAREKSKLEVIGDDGKIELIIVYQDNQKAMRYDLNNGIIIKRTWYNNNGRYAYSQQLNEHGSILFEEYYDDE